MIQTGLRFDELTEFYDRCDMIKKLYRKLSLSDKWHYKHYIYSKRHLTNNTCNLIWFFLNDILEDDQEITKEILLKNFVTYPGVKNKVM